MSVLRGIDRAHDIDLGPSGHNPAGTGMHFTLLSDGPSEAEAQRVSERTRKRAASEARRTAVVACGAVMRQGGSCARRAGHLAHHRSQFSFHAGGGS